MHLSAPGTGERTRVRTPRHLMHLLCGLVLLCSACIGSSGPEDGVQVGFVLRGGSGSALGDDERALVADAVLSQARGAGLESAVAKWEDEVLILTVPEATDPDEVLAVIEANRLSFRPVCADLPVVGDQAARPLPSAEDATSSGCEGTVLTIEEAEITADTPAGEVAGSAMAIISVPGDDDQEGTRLLIGRPLLTSEAVESAQPSFAPVGESGQWSVDLVFRDGSTGIDLFNRAAEECFDATPVCPTGRLAIVWNGEVVTSPVIQAPTFRRDAIALSGSFDEEAARDIVIELNRAQLLGLLEVSWTEVNP